MAPIACVAPDTPATPRRGTSAAVGLGMARPRRRDYFAWFTSLPASSLLVACLFLPQVNDCNGHDQTPFETNTWALILGLAVIGLLPLAWRWRPVREPAVYLVGIGTACALLVSVFGIAMALVLAVAYSRCREEELVALCCVSLVIVFIVLFPLVGLFATWCDGAYLTWGAAWLELAGMIAWTSAASAREDHWASPGHSSSPSMPSRSARSPSRM